jgi:hypothetical protein
MLLCLTRSNSTSTRVISLASISLTYLLRPMTSYFKITLLATGWRISFTSSSLSLAASNFLLLDDDSVKVLPKKVLMIQCPNIIRDLYSGNLRTHELAAIAVRSTSFAWLWCVQAQHRPGWALPRANFFLFNSVIIHLASKSSLQSKPCTIESSITTVIRFA